MSISLTPEPCPLDGTFAEKLLNWYSLQGRDLPWRRTRDPYATWVSEIMLQQTGVATVIPYYERFLQRFPRVSDLAAAELDEVIALWAGLGFYSRARHLHAAAIKIQEGFSGRLPDNEDDLMSLPGIGRSTAGAILALAFDRKMPILDGNVRRVLVRLFAVEDDPRRPTVEKQLWQWAADLTSAQRPHDYTQAIMDLGATLCTPRDPACQTCPAAGLCRARYLGKSRDLPRPRPAKKQPQRREAVLVLCWQEHMLLQKRPYGGMLGGLWEFPGAALDENENSCQAATELLARFGGGKKLCRRGESDHVYSHFRLRSEVFSAHVEPQGQAIGENEQAWLPVGKISKLPVHGAHKKVLQLLKDTMPDLHS